MFSVPWLFVFRLLEDGFSLSFEIVRIILRDPPGVAGSGPDFQPENQGRAFGKTHLTAIVLVSNGNSIFRPDAPGAVILRGDAQAGR